MSSRKMNYLQEIISTLTENGVDFIICGGVALVLHGIERMTMDLDLSVNLDEKNLKKFLRAMKALNLVPRAPVPADSILDEEKRRIMKEEKNALVFTFIDTANPYRQVDVFITDDISYDSLKDHTDEMRVSDSSVRVVSKKKLLEMKKRIENPRDKDIFDIRLLEKIIEKARDD